MKPRILVMSGSSRSGSLNTRLAHVAAHAITQAGGEVVWIDLAQYPMPLYNGDDETAHGIPPNTQALREQWISCQGLLLACPEYNASITPLLKNTLDWMSRSYTDAHGVTHEGLAPYRGKVAALVSASGGNLGGLRGLTHVRAVLQALQVLVLSEQLAVSQATQHFTEDRQQLINDTRLQTTLNAIVQKLVTTCQRLA